MKTTCICIGSIFSAVLFFFVIGCIIKKCQLARQHIEEDFCYDMYFCTCGLESVKDESVKKQKINTLNLKKPK